MSWLTDKWHSVRTAGSWRGLSTSDFWNDYDACIATTEQGAGGRGSTYEVWTFGQLISVGGSLQEAKDTVEQVYGKLSWETVKPKAVPVVHNFYGPTTEFTDPLTLHVIRKLPKL
jgi:hypothetical protein